MFCVALLGAALLFVAGAGATTPTATGIVVTASLANPQPTINNVYCGILPRPTPCSLAGEPGPAVQVRWGSPLGGSDHSGLAFAPTATPSVPLNQNFVVGALTHYNFPTAVGSALSSLDLAVTLTAQTPDGPVTFHLNQTIGIDETPNSGTAADCAYQPVITGPCPDALILPAGTASQTLPVGSVHQYTLQVLGYTASSTSTTAQDHLVTQENATNTGFLVASLSRDNRVPAANDDTGATTSGGSTTIAVLGNDTDGDNDALTPSITGGPAHGTAVVNPDGTITYTADASFAGTDHVAYTDSDGFSTSAPADIAITVTDATKPDITAPTGPVGAEASGPDGAVVTYTASATDNVDGSLAVDCVPPPGSTFALGTTHVVCTATDAAGNTQTATFDVVVSDTTAPTLSGVPSNQTAEATGPGGAPVTYTLPTATDAVDAHPHVSCVPASGSTFALGATTVTCTATDAAGNTSAPQTFTVTVQDTTAPTVTVPADMTVFSAGGTSIPVSFSSSATDLVDGTVPTHCTPASGSSFAVGTTTVTCTATDAAGNTGSASFTVTVIANRPPVCSAVGVQGVSGLWPVNHKLVLVTLAGATDPDGNTLTYRIDGVTQDEAVTGGGSGTTAFDAQRASGGSVWLRSERAGSGDGRVYTIAYTVTDQYGLSCSGTVDVAVPHDSTHAAVKSAGSYNSFGS